MCFCLKYLLISQFKLLKWSYTLSSMYSQSNNLESVDGDSFLLGTVPTISRLWGLPSHKMHFSGVAIMIHWISGIMFPVVNTFGLKILIIIKVCMVLWFWLHNITKTSVILIIFFLCRCISTARWQTHPNCWSLFWCSPSSSLPSYVA